MTMNSQYPACLNILNAPRVSCDIPRPDTYGQAQLNVAQIKKKLGDIAKCIDLLIGRMGQSLMSALPLFFLWKQKTWIDQPPPFLPLLRSAHYG